MAQQERNADREESTDALPSPPKYKPPYTPGDTPYHAYEVKGGIYGIMYAGEYEWGNARCTAEAYGDHRDPDDIPGRERQRALMFHTEWMDVPEARECLPPVGDSYNGYEGFDADAIDEILDSLTAEVKVVVAREASPSLYLWTDQPVPVMEAFTELPGEASSGALRVGNDQDPHPNAPEDAPRPPNVLGAFPNANIYPQSTLGETKSEIENGVPTLITVMWE